MSNKVRTISLDMSEAFGTTEQLKELSVCVIKTTFFPGLLTSFTQVMWSACGSQQNPLFFSRNKGRGTPRSCLGLTPVPRLHQRPF